MASPVLGPSLLDGGTYFPAEETAPPAGALSEGPPDEAARLVALSSSPASPVPLAKDSWSGPRVSLKYSQKLRNVLMMMIKIIRQLLKKWILQRN